MKRILRSIITGCIVIMTFCAWGGGQDSRQNQKVPWQRDWQREERIICQMESSMVKEVRVNKGDFAFRVNGSLYLGTGEACKEPIFVCRDTNLVDYCPDGQGGVYCIIQKEAEKESGIWLKRYTSEGDKEEIRLPDGFPEEVSLYSRCLTVDPEGTIFLCTESGWLLLDSNGNELDRFYRENASGDRVECASSESVLIHRYEAAGESFFVYDRASGEERKIAGLPYFGHYVCSVSEEGELLISTDSALFGCNEWGELTNLCTWTDYGIVGDDVLAVYGGEEGLHCLQDEGGCFIDICYRDNEKGEKGRTEDRQAGQKTLTLGCFGETVWLRRAVAGYNRESDCMISLVNYLDGDITEAVKKMEEDLRAGKGPDLIAFESSTAMEETLGREGLLESLIPYLERSAVVGKGDLVEPLYRTLLQEGKLYGMPVTFGIEAIITKEKWGGSKGNWTAAACLESMEKAAEENPSLEFGMDKEEWQENLKRYGGSDKSGEAGMSEVYRKIEKYLPENKIYIAEEAIRRQGSMFWETVIICDVEGYLYHKSAWGEDARFTGFPGAEGNGMALLPIDCYGISSGSRYKEEAWKFIESFFTETGREFTIYDRFSADRNVLEEQFRKALTEGTCMGQDGKTVEMPVLAYVTGQEIVEVYGASEEDIDEIKSMLEGMR